MRADFLPDYNPARLLSPERYGVVISLASFYSMISRGEAPKVTYFRGRPKFTTADIDEWVQRNISPTRK